MNNGTGTILDNLRMVILDCDGTIVDSQIGIVKVMQQTFEMYDLNIPKPRDVLFGVGLDLIKGISRLLPEGHNLDIIKMSETYKKLATYHRDNKTFEDQLYPEAEEVIRKLHASGWLLGIATGKSSRGLDHVLSLHDMTELFVTKQTSDRAAGKPNPEMLLNAMEQTGVSADEVFMVGDTTYDISMALNAGTHAIGVSWGYHGSAELIEAGAEVVVDSYYELFNFLNNYSPELRVNKK